MSELFIELYSEEMPFEFFNSIVGEIKTTTKSIFQSLNLIEEIKDNNLLKKLEEDAFCKVYYTPCRIILLINSLPEFIIVEHKEIFGPKIDAPQNEIEGFLKAFNLKSIDDLEIKNNNYILIRDNFKVKTKDIIEEKISNILNNIANGIHKTTKWDTINSENRWFSPLRNILCLFNGEIIKFKFCNLESNNYTFGHKIMVGLDKKIQITNFEDYKSKMSENFVIFDQDERKKIILNEIDSIEKELNAQIIDFNDNGYKFKEELIEEIIGRTEFPNISYGKFNEEYLKLPEKILSLIISKDFKCFCLKNNATDTISNNFILFNNIKHTDNANNIIDGFVNVINSRLNFVNLNLMRFISESLDSKITKLKKSSLNKDIGSIYNRIERIINISKFICFWITNCDLIQTEQAAQLCKIDITTSLVKSTPELKGILSAFYAKVHGYPKSVYQAIEEYYEPKTADDPIPETSIGRIISIAGKMDNITTLFIINEETSSSKDPYGIRKNIMSIIRIIVEGEINIPLQLLIHKSISLFRTSFYRKNKENEKTVKEKILNIEKNLIELFKTKFTSFLVDKGYEQHIINSVVKQKTKRKIEKININYLYKKVIEVDEFNRKYPKKLNDLQNIYKRIKNLSPNFEDNKIRNILNKIFINKHFENEQDKLINIKTNEIAKKINLELKAKNYINCLNLLYGFKEIIDEYFKNILIKTENNKETKRRLFLLFRIKKIFDKVINFSELK